MFHRKDFTEEFHLPVFNSAKSFRWNTFLRTSSHRSELLRKSPALRQSISDGGTSERGRSPEVISLSPAPKSRNPEMLKNKSHGVSSGLGSIVDKRRGGEGPPGNLLSPIDPPAGPQNPYNNRTKTKCQKTPPKTSKLTPIEPESGLKGANRALLRGVRGD